MRLLVINNNKYFKQAYEGDAGVDLYCDEDVTFLPFETKLVDLKVKCKMVDDSGNPVSYYLYPRSSIYKTPLRLANSVGIIDSGYRGNIKMPLDNKSDEIFVLKAGKSISQICSPTLSKLYVIIVDKLDETERGANGFGSSN
jgi:dUTP pyrophosphatase